MAAGLSVVVPEVLKVVAEEGVYMITDVINQTVVEKVILAQWEFSTIWNCLKGNRDALERVNKL